MIIENNIYHCTNCNKKVVILSYVEDLKEYYSSTEYEIPNFCPLCGKDNSFLAHFKSELKNDEIVD